MIQDILEFEVIPVVDTGIYADGDLLFDITTITEEIATRSGYIADVLLVDKADQKSGMEIVFMKESRDAGTINSAPTLSDAHALDILGTVQVVAGAFSTGHWGDMGGSSVASRTGQNIGFPAGCTGLYVFGVVRGSTPTFGAATDLVLKVKVHLTA